MALTPIEEQQLLEHLLNYSNPHRTTPTKSGLQTTDDLPEGLVNLYNQLGGKIYIEGAAPYLEIINKPNPEDGELWVSTTDDLSAGVTAGDGILYDLDTDIWTDIGPLQGPQGIPGPQGSKGDHGTPIHHTRFLREDGTYDYYGLWLDAAETEFIGEYAVRQVDQSGPPGSDAYITINSGKNLEGSGTFQLNQEVNQTVTLQHATLNSDTFYNFSIGIGLKTLTLNNGHITNIETQSFDSRYYLKGGDRLQGQMDAGNFAIINVQTITSDLSCAVNLATLQDYMVSHTHQISDIDNLVNELAEKMPITGGTFQGNVNFGNNILDNFRLPTDFSDPLVQRWPLAIGSIYGLLDDYLPRSGILGMAGHLSMSSEDEHGTTIAYHIHQMEQPTDIFDGTASDWAASIGLVATEFTKYLKHDGSIPLSGTLNANSNRIENLSAEFSDPDTNAARIGLVRNHTHPMSSIIDLADEFLKHYQKTEYLVSHVNPSDPTQSADHPIKLNTEGKINSEFIAISVFNNRGNWTPIAGTEYPDITGAIKGDFWMIDGVDDTLGYTFTTGDLNGETAYNGDLIILRDDSGTLVWLLRSSQIDPNIYLPLAGGTMLGNISMGDGFTITNILEDGQPNSIVTRASVVLIDGTNKMTGNLSIQKDTPSIYFDDTGSVNPNTWGYGILNGKCTIHIKLSDTTTEAKFTIDDDAKLLNLQVGGIYYNSIKLLDENSIIDADTLDGLDSTDFALSTHDHTTFVKKVGDIMTGNLSFSKFNVLINTSKGDTAETDSWFKGFYFLDNTDILYGGLGSYGSLDNHNYQFWGVGENPHEHGLRLYDDETFFLNAFEIYHTGNLDITDFAPFDHNHDADYLAIGGKAVDSALLNGKPDTDFSLITHDHDADYLAIGGKAVDSALLNGKADTEFSLSGHNHDADYLAINGKAVDSALLNGKADTEFSLITHDHDADYLATTGGNLTGNLSIISEFPRLYLNAIGSGAPEIQLQMESKTRFMLHLNTSEDFGISRNDTNGVYIDTPLYIYVNTGVVSFSKLPTCPAVPSADNQLVNKAYVDSQSGSGDTIWGDILGTLSHQTDLQGALDQKAHINHNHDTVYLGINDTAVNSYHLGGLPDTDFAKLNFPNTFRNQCLRTGVDSVRGYCTWDAKFDDYSLYVGQIQGHVGWNNYISSVVGEGEYAMAYPLRLVGDFYPDSDEAYNLGASHLKWRELFTMTIYQEGDETNLQDIAPIKTIDADFLLLLEPKSYKVPFLGITNHPMIADIPAETNSKTHFGFTAQDIDAALLTAGYVPDKFSLTTGDTGHRSVNYIELIPLLIKKIQDLETRIFSIENT